MAVKCPEEGAPFPNLPKDNLWARIKITYGLGLISRKALWDSFNNNLIFKWFYYYKHVHTYTYSDTEQRKYNFRRFRNFEDHPC